MGECCKSYHVYPFPNKRCNVMYRGTYHYNTSKYNVCIARYDCSYVNDTSITLVLIDVNIIPEWVCILLFSRYYEVITYIGVYTCTIGADMSMWKPREHYGLILVGGSDAITWFSIQIVFFMENMCIMTQKQRHQWNVI